jgi:hypothetical protein
MYLLPLCVCLFNLGTPGGLDTTFRLDLLEDLTALISVLPP